MPMLCVRFDWIMPHTWCINDLILVLTTTKFERNRKQMNVIASILVTVVPPNYASKRPPKTHIISASYTLCHTVHSL